MLHEYRRALKVNNNKSAAPPLSHSPGSLRASRARLEGAGEAEEGAGLSEFGAKKKRPGEMSGDGGYAGGGKDLQKQAFQS